ncbi:alpha/beta hydrolase [Pseudomonas sp. NFXW11]|uniref:alpha/beta hydrolase n=1 Tax=Pseudomonas sp. NFXW11 TaxID=2819531 RepID=UPI003CEAF3C1
MSPPLLQRLRLRGLRLLCLVLLVLGLPASCAVLQHQERKLVFRIEPGTAGWYRGLPSAVQEFELKPNSFKAGQNIHAWWYPAARADAPAILYLHGVRWNLTGQLFRIEQLHALGYSVLAIDYRGFGQSQGDLPSETSVYEDARIAWARFQTLQPDPAKRLIYGHSLGGAVAIDLAAELGRAAAAGNTPPAARGLIVESTFTTLADAAAAATKTALPLRWAMSLKFDSIDKIREINMPLLVVHGLKDDYIPPRLSQELFKVALQPKQLLLVPGGTHNNSMSLAGKDYARAINALLRAKPEHSIAGPVPSAVPTS